MNTAITITLSTVVKSYSYYEDNYDSLYGLLLVSPRVLLLLSLLIALITMPLRLLIRTVGILGIILGGAQIPLNPKP